MTIQCPKCNTTYKFMCILIRHLKLSSRCKTSDIDINNITSNITSTITSNIINNINSIINNKIIICIQCKTTFTKKSSLINHNKNSKCGKLQQAKITLNKYGIAKLTLEQLQLLEPETYNNITSRNHTNNTINNIINNNITNNNNIINNTIIQHINPFGFEDVRTIPIPEMKTILTSGTEAGLQIIKIIYNKIENKNFYKPNISRSEIACLNEDFNLTIYKSKEFCDALFDRCITFLHHMLYLCKDEYSKNNIKYIYDNIEHIETTMRTEIYDKKLQNIIETEFINNNINNKDRIKKFIKDIKDNVDTKNNSLLQLKNTTSLTEDKSKEYKISITNLELNNVFGDPKIILGLRKDEILLNIRISRFEESIFYNFWIDRIKNIKKYVMKSKKATIGDIVNLSKEETKILSMLDIIKTRVDNNRGDDYLDLNLNNEFRLDDVVDDNIIHLDNLNSI